MVFGLIIKSTKDRLTGEKVLVQEPYKNMTPKGKLRFICLGAKECDGPGFREKTIHRRMRRACVW